MRAQHDPFALIFFVVSRCVDVGAWTVPGWSRPDPGGRGAAEEEAAREVDEDRKSGQHRQLNFKELKTMSMTWKEYSVGTGINRQCAACGCQSLAL